MEVFTIGEKVHLAPVMQALIDKGKVRTYIFEGYVNPWTKEWAYVHRKFLYTCVETSYLRKIPKHDFQI
jgi:hypothetical protein